MTATLWAHLVLFAVSVALYLTARRRSRHERSRLARLEARLADLVSQHSAIRRRYQRNLRLIDLMGQLRREGYPLADGRWDELEGLVKEDAAERRST